jgi:hypothetical protein
MAQNGVKPGDKSLKIKFMRNESRKRIFVDALFGWEIPIPRWQGNSERCARPFIIVTFLDVMR